jgi:hypothetical protein
MKKEKTLEDKKLHYLGKLSKCKSINQLPLPHIQCGILELNVCCKNDPDFVAEDERVRRKLMWGFRN